jgi:hypothetical protein
VHEKKEGYDNLPDTNDDISRQLHAILHGRYLYVAETVGSFVSLRAPGNESLASKCRNSGGRTPFGRTVHKRNSFFDVRSRNVIENKQRKEEMKFLASIATETTWVTVPCCKISLLI